MPMAAGMNGRWGGQGGVSSGHVRAREFLPGSGEGSGRGEEATTRPLLTWAIRMAMNEVARCYEEGFGEEEGQGEWCH